MMVDVSSIGDSSAWDNGYDNFEATDGESKAGPCTTKTQADILFFWLQKTIICLHSPESILD